MPVWLLETCNGDYETFKNLPDARAAAEKWLMSLKYNPITDEDEVFKELSESYSEDRGFWVDELCWCWQINYNF